MVTKSLEPSANTDTLPAPQNTAMRADGFHDAELRQNLQRMQRAEQAERDRRAELQRRRELARLD